jgi:hypothetical protein
MKMRQWTQEERQRQAQLIKKWKPWTRSTGAKTFEGKERSKMNALKDGAYSGDMLHIWDYMQSFKRKYVVD